MKVVSTLLEKLDEVGVQPQSFRHDGAAAGLAKAFPTFCQCLNYIRVRAGSVFGLAGSSSM